jgi:hypothetical protein
MQESGSALAAPRPHPRKVIEARHFRGGGVGDERVGRGGSNPVFIRDDG